MKSYQRNLAALTLGVGVLFTALAGLNTRSEAVNCLEPLPTYALTCGGVPISGASIKVIQINQPVQTKTTNSAGYALFSYVRPASAQVIEVQFKKSNEIQWHSMQMTVTPNGAGCGDPVMIDPGTSGYNPCGHQWVSGELRLKW